MYRRHPIFALLFSILLLFPCMVSHAAEIDAPILMVDGEGSAQDIPDQAIITISVTSQAEDAKTVQYDNAQKSQAVQEAIRALGIHEKDIQTRSYSFHPIYSYEKNNRSSITGYQADNSIVVTIRDLNLTGQIIDTVLTHGANNISSLDFDIHNKDNLRKQAILSAIKDAKSKASLIADGLGRRIIGIKSVSENTGSISHRSFNLSMMANRDGMESTPIEAGTLSLNASVHIEFILSN